MTVTAPDNTTYTVYWVASEQSVHDWALAYGVDVFYTPMEGNASFAVAEYQDDAGRVEVRCDLR